MADEVVKTGDGGEQAPEPKQFTEIEKKAADQGWRPKDEWDGEPEDWRSAREFLDRGEFFKKIEDQNRTIKQLKQTQHDLTKHLDVVRKTEFKRALEVLKAEKRVALEEQDAGKVIEIDEQIASTREAIRAAESMPQPQVDPELNPIFVSWKERNNWYDSNSAMRAYADRLGSQMTGMSPSDILTEVERQVKKEFAHKFEGNPRRERPGAVEGDSKKAPSKKDTFVMTDEERRVMQRFVRSGALTEEQYIKDLKEAKARGQ